MIKFFYGFNSQVLEDKKNLVLFTDSFNFEDSTSQFNSQIAKHLSKKNNITVLTCKKIFSKVPNFEIPQKGLKIIRLPTFFANRKSLPLKITKFICLTITFSIFLIFRKIKKEVFLICSSPPIIIPPLIFILKCKSFYRKQNIKKVLLCQDIYPDCLGELEKFKNIKYLSMKFLSFIYSLVYREFNFAICCSKPIQDKLVNKYFLDDKNVKVIKNWTLISKNKINSHISKKLTEQNKIKMFLIGNVGKPHLYMQTANSLKNIISKSKLIDSLHMYTRGCHHLDIYNQLKQFSNVYLHELVPANDLPKVYSEPSITVVPLTKNVSLCAFPSRIATAVSLGSPVLVITDQVQNNYLAYFVKKHNIGLVINKSHQLNNGDWISNQFKLEFNTYQENCLNLYRKLFTKEKNLALISNFIENTHTLH